MPGRPLVAEVSDESLAPDRTRRIVNGLRLHLLDWGGEGRPPLLLLHGFTGHAHAWDTLSIALQPHFHVLALDQRGHGDSDPADTYNAVAAFDDIAGVVDQLGSPPWSSSACRWAAATRCTSPRSVPSSCRSWSSSTSVPRSARAPARPPGPPEPETWDSIEQAAQHLYRGNPLPGIHYYRWVASHSLRARPDGAMVWKWHPSVKERRSTGDVDWWAVVRAIPPPTLVLRGEHSPVLDRDVAERMAKELPRGRFVEIPRAVHTLHEDNPEAVLAALKEFLVF